MGLDRRLGSSDPVLFLYLYNLNLFEEQALGFIVRCEFLNFLPVLVGDL